MPSIGSTMKVGAGVSVPLVEVSSPRKLGQAVSAGMNGELGRQNEREGIRTCSLGIWI